MMRKCNWGCGSIVAPGWHNVDLQDFGQQFIGSTELFEDNYFDIIVAHCSLQMVEWHDLPKVLKDLYRILKPGGVLRISLPDIITGFEAFQAGNISWFPNGEEDINLRFSAWITWYSTSKTLLTQGAAFKLLRAAGFPQVIKREYKISSSKEGDEICELDTRNGEAFFIDSIK